MKTRKNKSKKHKKTGKTRYKKVHHKKVHHNHDEKFKPQCSPNPNNKGYTCYSDEALTKMKYYWNARHPHDKIVTSDTYRRAAEHVGTVCPTPPMGNLTGGFSEHGDDTEPIYLIEMFLPEPCILR